MTCRVFADFISDYLAGGLSPEELARFERHLSRCSNCVRYLAQYRDAVSLGRAAFADLDAAVPEDVPEDLIAAIVSSRAG